MTRLMQRIIEFFKPRKRHEQFTDPVFWQALSAIHREYFERALIDYGQTGRASNHIYHQLCTLDCWLDLAIEQGCLDEAESDA